MTILVAYATTYGATGGIAEHIARELTAAGHDAEARPAAAVKDVSGCSAVVVGGAVFAGRWHRDARAFVRRHHAALRARPVWLFSSGPLGTATHDKDGHDLVEASRPLDLAKHEQLTGARGSTVFFGALDPSRLNPAGRLMMRVPAAREVMIEGDFRDWPAIGAWARAIADELDAPAP